MKKAENYEIILNGARSSQEFKNALNQAKNDSIAEEYEKNGGLTKLAFSDNSVLKIDVEKRSAELVE